MDPAQLLCIHCPKLLIKAMGSTRTVRDAVLLHGGLFSSLAFFFFSMDLHLLFTIRLHALTSLALLTLLTFRS